MARSFSFNGDRSVATLHSEPPPALTRPRVVASYSASRIDSPSSSSSSANSSSSSVSTADSLFSPPASSRQALTRPERPMRPASSPASRTSSSDSIASDSSATSLGSGSGAEPAEKLLQLVYTSAAYSRDLSREEISDILFKSRQYNASKNITGLLLYRDGTFAQFLEGPPDAVNHLYGKIEADPRHRGVVRVLRRTTDKRDFSRWDMAFRDLDLDRKSSHKPASNSAQRTPSPIGRCGSQTDLQHIEDAREGFSQLLNVGLKLGDHQDTEIRPDAWGIGRAKLALPVDMSAQIRKLITTFYRLLDRPL